MCPYNIMRLITVYFGSLLGILESVIDANVGSIFGIGFAPWTGGAIQFLNQNGVKQSLQRSEELASKYGERFIAPRLLRKHAESGEVFK